MKCRQAALALKKWRALRYVGGREHVIRCCLERPLLRYLVYGPSMGPLQRVFAFEWYANDENNASLALLHRKRKTLWGFGEGLKSKVQRIHTTCSYCLCQHKETDAAGA